MGYTVDNTVRNTVPPTIRTARAAAPHRGDRRPSPPVRTALCFLGHELASVRFAWPAWVVRRRPWDWERDG